MLHITESDWLDIIEDMQDQKTVLKNIKNKRKIK